MDNEPNEPIYDAAEFKDKAAAGPFDNASGLRKLWPFAFQDTPKGRQLFIHKGRLAALLATLLLTLWLAGATGVWGFIKYGRGMDTVRYLDILFLPVRMTEYQRTRGDFYVDQAKKELEAGKYRDAFFHLRLGVIKSPGNKEGRQLLIQFYSVWNRADLAEKTLVEGIPYNRDNAEFIRTLFIFLLRQQEDQKVLEIAKDLLGTGAVAVTPVNQLAAFAAATAHYYRGNFDKAEDILRAYQLAGMRDGRLLLTRLDWERGQKEQAIARLRQLLKEFPSEPEIYNQLVAYLLSSNRDDEARRESFARALADPRNARARIDLLNAYRKAGDTEQLAASIEGVYRDVSQDQNALLQLANFAATAGDVPLAARIETHMKETGMKWEGAALMRVEALIVAKRHAEAVEAVATLRKESPVMPPNLAGILTGLDAIANFGAGDPDSGQISLNAFLKQNNLRTENIMAVSTRLLAIGARHQARQALATAVRTDPSNQAALTALIKLDVELGNTDEIAKNVRTLLTMRRPPADVLRSAHEKLSSDLYLFAPGRAALLEELETALTRRPPSTGPPGGGLSGKRLLPFRNAAA
ncbi:MAG: hypothetical protein LBR12_00855 [Opitutaceae bacterium]|jgi:tetratricopeptide (TPR) repeat protein|nr:hypothetical protein [Opitutaceae bacterium]